MRGQRRIELSQPAFDAAEARALARTLRSGWVGLGPRTARFEERFAAYVGARHCVATSSGTAALHLSLRLLDLGPDDEVIVPALTYVSTAHAVRYVGARVVLADVSPDTLTLDPADVARKITRRTRAVIPMHYGGHPCAMDEIHGLAAAAGLTVIEDAAHATGAVYKGRRIGSLSPLTCFSFQAAKNMTTGEGGAVTCASRRHAIRLRRLRALGISPGLWRRRTRAQPWRWEYQVQEVGHRYAMHDLAAAIGLVQLAKLARHNARRRRLAARYREALADLPWISMPLLQPWARSAHYTFAILTRRRRALARFLGARRVMTGVHYLPIHRQRAYRHLRARVPIADAVWRRILLLPLHPRLSDRAQAYVIDQLRAFGSRWR
jgi:perosamine synthetase